MDGLKVLKIKCKKSKSNKIEPNSTIKIYWNEMRSISKFHVFKNVKNILNKRNS